MDYVYPGSPADEAGLKRGDIILSIHHTLLDTTNYYDLYSGDSYFVQLGQVESNTLSFTGESIDLVASTAATDPAIYHTVFDINGQKIGYMVYVEFNSGDDDEFLSVLDGIFSEFSAAGISDLIVDLRYNPGGEISAAAHLASEVAPSEVSKGEGILVRMQYNFFYLFPL